MKRLESLNNSLFDVIKPSQLSKIIGGETNTCITECPSDSWCDGCSEVELKNDCNVFTSTGSSSIY